MKMRIARFRTLVVGLVLLGGIAAGEARPAKVAKQIQRPALAETDLRATSGRWQELFDLPTARVQISWSDMKELIERAQPPEPREEEKFPPPVDWTLAGVAYDAQAVSNRSVRVNARFQVVVWKEEGWVEVPIIGDSVAPSSVTLDGEETFLVRSKKKDTDGTLSLPLDAPGVHSLELTFFVACTARDGIVSFSFPCVPTAVTQMKLRIPVRDADVRSALAANIAVTRGAKDLTADLTFRSSDRIEVSWTLPAVLDKYKREAAPPESPRITCLASTLAVVTDHYVACRSVLRYDVLRGSTQTFRLGLPTGTNVLAVEGQGIAWTQNEDGTGEVIEVKVNREIADVFDLQVHYEAPFGDEQAVVAVPALTALDVVRDTGYIGVTAMGAVEISAGPEVVDITRMDGSELPAAVRAMSSNPILLAYKYTQPGYLLSLDIHRLEDVPVRVAGIDETVMTTVLTEDGTAITRVVYHVRNNVKQFLRVVLEDGAEVWGAEVAGKPVKPARQADSDAIQIPLLKSVETGRQLGAFPVSLVYMERIDPIGGLRDTVQLRTPTTDILANEVRWSVLLPESRGIYRVAGDLRRVGAQRMAAGRRPGSVLQRDGAGSNEETIYALREGIERFFITDINNPAASAGGANVRNRGAPLRAVKPADTAIAGVLPVQVNLPMEGIPHHFRRILVEQGAKLTLTLHTYDSRLNRIPQALAFVLGLAAAFVGVGWLLGAAGEPRGRFALTALGLFGAILLVVALMTDTAMLGRLCLGGAAGVGGALGVCLLRASRSAAPTRAAESSPGNGGTG